MVVSEPWPQGNTNSAAQARHEVCKPCGQGSRLSPQEDYTSHRLVMSSNHQIEVSSDERALRHQNLIQVPVLFSMDHGAYLAVPCMTPAPEFSILKRFGTVLMNRSASPLGVFDNRSSSGASPLVVRGPAATGPVSCRSTSSSKRLKPSRVWP